MACLAALDVDIDGPDWIERAFHDLDQAPWRHPLPPCVVVEEGVLATVDVHVWSGHEANVWVRLEDGSTTTLEQVANDDPDRMVDNQMVGRASFRLPQDAPIGYHTVFLASDDHYWQTPYIVTPAWLGSGGLGLESVWGFMAQLYSVCGQSSWGIGDFTDLTDLAVWAKTAHGADFVLMNPIHAAQVTAPMEPSPYFPVTRRFINPIYIRPEAIEEYATASEVTRRSVRQCRARAQEASQASPFLERDAVWRAKAEALRLIFRTKRRVPRQMAWDAYVEREGVALHQYATWCALSEVHGQVWQNWPSGLTHPDSAEVAEFAQDHEDEIGFHMWLQWVADEQWRAAQTTATRCGMRVGVVSDLAVGINREGEETWAAPDMFARGVTVGAPPDAYNQAGQDWRQPPWRPDRLAQAGYAPLRDMVAAALRGAGAVRIDHIIGLFRLWWIPEGMDPTQGAYVRYDFQAMVGIVALEAVRANATIIGEDLGTVEPSARQYLAAHGILGTSILWFENDDRGEPIPPERWRELCLASVTTHDLPPTLGYLAHDHVALRYRLGLLTESLSDEIARDADEQAAVLGLLARLHLTQIGETDPCQILLGLHRFLYQTPARLKCVALTDAVGERRTQNQPGTVDEYPNWRIPLADGLGHRLTLEQIYALTSVNEVSDIMNGKV
ncbi:MAG: 4-alpha-glucanotransferase [Propionibacteriaceae bacterium]|jgi:4-alpha-glucanotransferase|nr:4-alpha-glucanotransferase [Propionibacteriaceae bacterium]